MRIRALSDADPDIITAKCDSINKKITRKEKNWKIIFFPIGVADQRIPILILIQLRSRDRIQE